MANAFHILLFLIPMAISPLYLIASDFDDDFEILDMNGSISVIDEMLGDNDDFMMFDSQVIIDKIMSEASASSKGVYISLICDDHYIDRLEGEDVAYFDSKGVCCLPSSLQKSRSLGRSFNPNDIDLRGIVPAELLRRYVNSVKIPKEVDFYSRSFTEKYKDFKKEVTLEDARLALKKNRKVKFLEGRDINITFYSDVARCHNWKIKSDLEKIANALRFGKKIQSCRF